MIPPVMQLAEGALDFSAPVLVDDAWDRTMAGFLCFGLDCGYLPESTPIPDDREGFMQLFQQVMAMLEKDLLSAARRAAGHYQHEFLDHTWLSVDLTHEDIADGFGEQPYLRIHADEVFILSLPVFDLPPSLALLLRRVFQFFHQCYPGVVGEDLTALSWFLNEIEVDLDRVSQHLDIQQCTADQLAHFVEIHKDLVPSLHDHLEESDEDATLDLCLELNRFQRVYKDDRDFSARIQPEGFSSVLHEVLQMALNFDDTLPSLRQHPLWQWAVHALTVMDGWAERSLEACELVHDIGEAHASIVESHAILYGAEYESVALDGLYEELANAGEELQSALPLDGRVAGSSLRERLILLAEGATLLKLYYLAYRGEYAAFEN